MTIKIFSGWALDRACEIDSSYPGFVGSLLRASIERRQVVFAYLSTTNLATRFDDDASLGLFLTKAGHAEILDEAFGTGIVGLRSCLARSGERLHPRRHYQYLAALMRHPTRGTMRNIVSRLNEVTPERLRIIRALPEKLRDVHIIEALRSLDDARDVARLFNLLVAAGVQEVALKQALSTIRTMADVRRMASKWGQRVTFPAHPIPAAPGYTPVTNGAELKDAALRLRNCSRSYIPRVMERRSAFAIVSFDGVEAMAHLTREHEEWELDALYAPGNCRPDIALKSWAEAYLAKHGLMRRVRRIVEREWSCMRRLTGHLDFETD